MLQLIDLIVSGLTQRYSGKGYIHWRDHHPRTEGKARCLAAAEAWEVVSLDARTQLTHEDLIRIGIDALHRLGWPPLCYDDKGDVYILFANGCRQYTGQTYSRWVKEVYDK